MIPEMAKARIEELSREELIALLYKLMNRIHELEEQLRLKKPTSSKSSSQPPSRDFKGEKKKRKRKKGAKFGHEKLERALMDNPTKCSTRL